jgi:signal peptidase I
MPEELQEKARIEEAEGQFEAEQAPGVGSFLWELARVVIIAFIIMLVFRFFVAEPFIVSGASMVPNFHNKEYLIISKIQYRFHEPERGDVVVFKYPKDPSQYFIKRIIGLPGEKVQLQEGRLRIFNANHPEGFVLQEPYLPAGTQTLGHEGTFTLEKDEFYVLGDNRDQSSDSRVWGVLPKYDLVGRAWLRVFPLPQFGIIDHPDLND